MDLDFTLEDDCRQALSAYDKQRFKFENLAEDHKEASQRVLKAQKNLQRIQVDAVSSSERKCWLKVTCARTTDVQ